jgi:hypothetical protein
MLYSEIFAVCSRIQAKHINTSCEQKAEFSKIKLAVHIVTNGLWYVRGRINHYETWQTLTDTLSLSTYSTFGHTIFTLTERPGGVAALLLYF